MTSTARALIRASERLRDEAAKLSFSSPVAYVYNPLEYAFRPHRRYLERFGEGKKRVVLMGMNPGPFGMAQTGVPFGAVEQVRGFLGIEEPVGRPSREHPKRPVEGFACRRNEVSGARLWGAIAARHKRPEAFFRHHLVVNYIPLLFLEESGRNLTPDKIKKPEREPLEAISDEHIRRVVEILEPEWVIGIGAFAKKSAARAVRGRDVKLGTIPHPSPASPAANRDWAGLARAALEEQGVPVFL